MKTIRILSISVLFCLASFEIKSQGTWMQIDSISPWYTYSMDGGVGFSINGKGYYAMGDTSLCTYTKALWEYDPTADIWVQKADYMGTARWGAVSFVVGNVAYVGLGYDRITGSQNSFYAYNQLSNTWSSVAGLPSTGRVFSSSFVIGNKGYVGLGGYYNGLTGYCDTVYEQVWEYTSTTNTWLRKNDFPGEGRLNAISWSISGKGYWGTGVSIDTAANVGKDLWEYNSVSDSWTQKPDYPYGDVYSAVGFNIGNYGYITCGMSFASCLETWQFNPSTSTWTRMADFPGIDHALSASFSIGTKGYMVGGFNTDAWSFDPGNVGVNENPILLDINIYPNPFMESATIEFENIENKEYVFDLYDLKGSLVRSQKVESDKTTLSKNSLVSGVYIWKIFDEEKLIGSGKIGIK